MTKYINEKKEDVQSHFIFKFKICQFVTHFTAIFLKNDHAQNDVEVKEQSLFKTFINFVWGSFDSKFIGMGGGLWDEENDKWKDCCHVLRGYYIVCIADSVSTLIKILWIDICTQICCVVFQKLHVQVDSFMQYKCRNFKCIYTSIVQIYPFY